MKQKSMGSIGKGKHTLHKHVGLMGIFIGVLFLVSVGIIVASATTPTITDWNNTKTTDNPKDIMFLVAPDDVITFSVIVNQSVDYTWEVNKEDQNNNQNSFTWTVPNEKGIWEIHLKSSNAEGEDHIEWVVSTLSISEAPDFFDYFADGNLSSRNTTDPWGRSLPKWSFDMGLDSTMEASEMRLRIPYGIGYSSSRILSSSSISFGTWKFRLQYPNGVGPGKGQLRFYPMGQPFAYYMCSDCHNYFISPLGAAQMDEDGGIFVKDKWYNITIIRTADHWFYAYIDGVLEYIWYENSTVLATSIGVRLTTMAGYDDDFPLVDCIESYNNAYLFPVKEIKYTEYIDNWYWEKPGIWGSEYKRTHRTGIVINGRNVTLRDINNSINNASIFTYDEDTKTAIAYADIAVLDGAELIIKDETLKIHSDYDGEHQLAVLFGSTLRVENSTITSTNDHYYAFRLASSTHFGYPTGLMLEISETQDEARQCYASAQVINISNSIINNTAYLFFDSPYVLHLKNVQFTNLNEIDIGEYSHHPQAERAFRKDFVQGNKSFWLFLKQFGLNGFEMSNVTFTGKEEPLNITIMLCDEREKLNFYNLNAENETIKIRKSVRMWSFWQGDYPHYYEGTLGLVNSKFGTLEVATDKTRILPKYYLDILVVDANGVPVSNAKVTITNEQTDMDYPSENISPFEMKNCGWYWTAPPIITSYSPLRATVTGLDGHTPPPLYKANTLVITDYVKDINGTQEFTYNISASKDGKVASISSLDIDESWYRDDPDIPTKTVVCNIDTGKCWVNDTKNFLQITNATITPTPTEAGWNNVTPVIVTFFRTDNCSDGFISYTNYSKTSETGPWTTVNVNTATGHDAENVADISESRFNVTVSEEGITEIWFYSVDNNSNPEAIKNVTVKMDTTSTEPELPDWWSYYVGCGEGTWGRTTAEAHTGNYSVFLKGTAYEYETDYINLGLIAGKSNGYSGPDAYTVVPNTTYDLSFWLKGDFTNIGVYAMTWNTEEGSSGRASVSTSIGWITPTATWTRYEGTFTTPADAKKFVVMFQAYGDSTQENLGTIYVDDVDVNIGAGNLMMNPGAEGTDSCALSGTVTTNTTQGETGLADATVTLTTVEGTEINTTQTDSTGRYEFTDVSPGNYDITATKRSYWPDSDPVTVTTEAPETADIVLCQKGDLNTNSEPADAGDLAMMADATAAGTSDVTYDLDGDGNPADEADLTLLKDVSVGVAELE